MTISSIERLRLVADADLRDRWTDIFRRDPLVHLGLMASIVAATFQGYLKDRIAGPLPYALSDAAFLAAAVIWFGSMAVRHDPVRGPGYVPAVLLAVTLVPAFYLLHPGTPLLIKLAGLRAWSEFPVGCLIALSIIRTPGQVRAHVGLVLILCVITAVYGIAQYQGGSQTILSAGGLAVARHGETYSYYLPGTGRVAFRAFSTFSLSAAFGMMMVFGMVLAAGRAVSRTSSVGGRWWFALLIPLLFVGMTVSGTRAAFLILMASLLLLARYRGFSPRQIGLLVIVLLALHLGSLATSGLILERYSTVLLQEGVLWAYIRAPLVIAYRALTENPVGYGLGRTGVGVPFSMIRMFPPSFFMGSDGDIGRAGVEMGLVGIMLVLAIVIGLLPPALRAGRALLATDADDLALGLPALLVGTGAGVLIGSPISSAPHGIIWWFLLGCLFKLAMMAEDRAAEPDGGTAGAEGAAGET